MYNGAARRNSGLAEYSITLITGLHIAIITIATVDSHIHKIIVCRHAGGRN